MARSNKLQILNGGDKMRCLDTESAESAAEKRDNSFVRVSDPSHSIFHTNWANQFTLFPDKNHLDPAQRDVPVLQVQYGRLRYIIVFELPALPRAGPPFSQSQTYRLACIQPCQLSTPGDATVEFVEMEGMKETPIFVHIGVVECSVGRVKTHDHKWNIIDRSSEWARTVFIPEDVEDDTDDV